MTGLEFKAAGVRFERGSDSLIRVHGPADRRELLEELRFEVAIRLHITGRNPQPWHCDLCGDRIGHGTNDTCPLCREDGKCVARKYGGTCVLCQLAGQTLREEGKQ